MPALVGVRTGDADDGVVLFEGEFSEAALEEIAIADRIQDVVAATRTSVSTVAATIRSCASGLIAAFDDLATPSRSGGSLSQAVIELGVSVTGEGNVIVAKGSAEANLKVTLTWEFT